MKLGEEVRIILPRDGRDLLPGLPEVRGGAGPGRRGVGGGLPGPPHPRLPDLAALLVEGRSGRDPAASTARPGSRTGSTT